MPSTAQQPAPWRALFLSHLSQLRSPEIVLASVQCRSSDPLLLSHVPRARTCVFRSMWAELPQNSQNEAPRNAPVYASDMLTFTSDARMGKVSEILSSGSPADERAHRNNESGRGGPVEAIVWIEPTRTQWRVRGRAYIIGSDIDDESVGASIVREELLKRMRVVSEQGLADWAWSKEATAHFGNLSPRMRGSFKNPPPGSPKSDSYDNKDLVLGQKVWDLDDEVARKNFTVVIIRPDEVEQLDLQDPDRARRWLFTYDEVSGWEQQEVWP